MSRKIVLRIAHRVAAGLALLPVLGHAGSLDVTLTDARGQLLEGIGIVVDAPGPVQTGATPPLAVIDQRHEQFVPRVLIVQRGTEVAFPNTDRVQHHVYSFSPAKQFELALYRGNEHPPVVFEHSGIVVLGCNIHDHMIGYVLVVDSPYFAFSGHDGRANFAGLPNDSVKVTVWHPDLGIGYGRINRTVDLASGEAHVDIRIDQAWRPQQEASLSWNDY
jgi:plastocyanin